MRENSGQPRKKSGKKGFLPPREAAKFSLPSQLHNQVDKLNIIEFKELGDMYAQWSKGIEAAIIVMMNGHKGCYNDYHRAALN